MGRFSHIFTSPHWNVVAHSLDFIAVIIVAFSIISITHKHHARNINTVRKQQEELDSIESSMHQEKIATIIATILVFLAFVIKLGAHFAHD